MFLTVSNYQNIMPFIRDRTEPIFVLVVEILFLGFSQVVLIHLFCLSDAKK